MQITDFPRVKIADLPTPLQEMPNLTKKLGGPGLLIKRDDTTGLAFGGNKGRKLEFIVADAKNKGADTLITWAGTQSNWCVQTASIARKMGMNSVLVLQKSPFIPLEWDGNLLLMHILGADIRITEAESGGWWEVPKVVKETVEELKEKGRNPYIIPIGGSMVGGSMDKPLGAIGYANAMLELITQSNDIGIKIDCTVNACGSGSTQAGLIFGAKVLNTGIKSIGISVSYDKESLTKIVAKIVKDTARLLKVDLSVTPEDIIVFDDYVGEGYGALNREVVDAIVLVAETEGIFLDPVYTGKAMAGLIDLIKKDYFTKKDTVVLLHTGGTVALFPYKKKLREFVKKIREVNQ